MRKKTVAFAMSMMLGAALVTGCGKQTAQKGSDSITVVSREEGSGTRGAFVELVGIEENDVDNTTVEASITNNTAVMLTTVSGNPEAIGYVSLGSLDDSVKAVSIDGVEATAENVANNTYSIARPFNIATKDGLNDAAKDFITYILSDQGQDIIEENGYIKVADGDSYQAQKVSGTVKVSGSSSVTPVMEKLKEAYEAVNSDVSIEIQESDSSTGMSDVAAGTSDIGMASRDLKDSETSQGLTSTEIAKDGIAVIVNKDNKTEALTTEQVKQIFTGKITSWSEIEG